MGRSATALGTEACLAQHLWSPRKACQRPGGCAGFGYPAGEELARWQSPSIQSLQGSSGAQRVGAGGDAGLVAAPVLLRVPQPPQQLPQQRFPQHATHLQSGVCSLNTSFNSGTEWYCTSHRVHTRLTLQMKAAET